MAIHFDFVDRVALVTGGASGIGAAVAERLRMSGAEVHVFDLSAGDDVRDPRQIEAAIARLPRLDVLVCAAGTFGSLSDAVDVGDDEWRNVHAVNLDGVFFANRAAIPGMREQRYGRIVNVASIAGKEGNARADAYTSSKAAVIGVTKSIAKGVAGSGILVNCIAPAMVRTPILDGIPEEFLRTMASLIPLRRAGEVSEAAALICWLASEEMSFSTGACFDLSGGRATY